MDALVLNDDGNVLDALGLACRAALANTRIPRVDLVAGENGEEPELELDDDMDNAVLLDITAVPVMVSVSQVGAAGHTQGQSAVATLPLPLVPQLASTRWVLMALLHTPCFTTAFPTSAPMLASWLQVGHEGVMDMSLQEEACASATLHVAVSGAQQHQRHSAE